MTTSKGETIMTHTNTTAKTRSAAVDNVNVEISKAGINTIGIASGLIGCWAVACLVSGMIASGGPVTLVLNYVSAVIG